jgi:predicted small secreted protein
VRVRQLAVAAVAIAVASAGLTACNTKVGAAAIVGGDRISDNSVQRYVQPGAQPATQTDQTSGQTSTLIPKVQALQELVELQVFQDALDHYGPATPGELTAARASYLTSQGATEAQVSAALTKDGFTPRFTDLYLEVGSYLTVLEARLKDDGSGTATVAGLNKLKIPVQVSPRYGTWDGTSYSISSGASDGLPSFVKLTGASATPAAG